MSKFYCFLVIILVIVVIGCGNLSRNVSYNRLSDEDIKYIENLEKPAEGRFSISTFEGKFVADNVGDYLIFSPVFYLETVGKGTYDSNIYFSQPAFGARKTFCLIPFFAFKESLFSQKGELIGGDSFVGIPVLFGYQSIEFKKDASWRFNLVDVPFVNMGLIGFGKNYFRFLFITYDPKNWHRSY